MVALTAALPAPGGSGISGLPVRPIFQTAPIPALTARLTPAGGGGSGLPFTVISAPRIQLAPAGAALAGLPFAALFTYPAPPQPALAAWQRDVQPWAVAQERQRHVQALWQYGELVMFALLWHIEDYQAGFAARCPRCYANATSQTGPSSPPPIEEQIAAVYGQGNQARCPLCYQSTFVASTWTGATAPTWRPGHSAPAQLPGVRALIVRPAILTDTDKDQRKDTRGVINTARVAAETTPDFRVRTGDLLLRGDGTRFQLQVPRRTTLRSGFALPWQATAAIDYNQLNAALEDPASVAYSIPPDQATLAQILGTYTRIPVDYYWAEVVNAPLIPEEAPPPAAFGASQGNVILGS